MGADLHVHTVASDGTSTVSERVTQAVNRGVDTVALTDHDCIAADLTTPSQTRRGVELITGVEIRADLFDTKIELLGYYVDPTNEQLQRALKQARTFRQERNEKLVRRLADVTGLDVSHDDLVDETEGELGRPHLASMLVEEGLVDSIGGAFDEYLAENGEAYVPMERLPYREVLDAIHAAGGVASLAHPGRIRSDRVPEMAAELSDAGLDAIEVWYPYDEAGNKSGVGVDRASELADEHDLLQTGGSDCHGPESGKFRLGGVTTPREHVSKLRDAAPNA